MTFLAVSANLPTASTATCPTAAHDECVPLGDQVRGEVAPVGEGTGANTEEAHAGGSQAEAIAAGRIMGTAVDFEEAITKADNGSGSSSPGITEWSSYKEQADKLRDVEDQCRDIAENIQGGAEEFSVVDQDSRQQFRVPGDDLGELSRYPNAN